MRAIASHSAVLVVGWLVACGPAAEVPARPAPVDRSAQAAEAAPAAPVDRCIQAMVAARSAPADGTNARASSIAVGCADLYRLPACREAHANAYSLSTPVFAATIVHECAREYCPVLVPRPTVCARVSELLPSELPAAWHELDGAILRRDLSASDLARLAAVRGAP